MFGVGFTAFTARVSINLRGVHCKWNSPVQNGAKQRRFGLLNRLFNPTCQFSVEVILFFTHGSSQTWYFFHSRCLWQSTIQLLFVSISLLSWKKFSLTACQSLLKFLTLTAILNIKYCILKLSYSSL